MMESATAMDTSNDFEDDVEDGELVEDGEIEDDGELVEDVPKIFDSESDKLSLRAKRFGLLNPEKPCINPELEKFQKSMGVDKDTRAEALHLLGTDNMKTLDVFAYFSGYSPASIEWISDNCCNVVWLDEESCAKALKNRSIKIKGLSVETDDLDESEESVNIEDIRCALPPGIWRKGQASSLAPHLFIRYATRFDKKGMKPQNVQFFGNGTFNRNIFLDEGDEVAKKLRLETGNPWADIARQWRNFENRAHAAPVTDARDRLNLREIKKPKYMLERLHVPPPKNEEYEPRPSILSSRKMHADIEEKKIQERNKLRSKHPQRGKPVEIDLRERLGRKRKRIEVDYDEPDDDDGDDVDWKQKVPSPEKDDVLLRIEIDNSRDDSDSDRGSQSTDSNDSDEIKSRPNASDLRKKLQRKKSSHHHKKSSSSSSANNSVLRTKYIKHSQSGTKPVYSPLRIEIDNDVYQKSSSDED